MRQWLVTVIIVIAFLAALLGLALLLGDDDGCPDGYYLEEIPTVLDPYHTECVRK